MHATPVSYVNKFVERLDNGERALWIGVTAGLMMFAAVIGMMLLYRESLVCPPLDEGCLAVETPTRVLVRFTFTTTLVWIWGTFWILKLSGLAKRKDR